MRALKRSLLRRLPLSILHVTRLVLLGFTTGELKCEGPTAGIVALVKDTRNSLARSASAECHRSTSGFEATCGT
jgi:hypothetical protein